MMAVKSAELLADWLVEWTVVWLVGQMVVHSVEWRAAQWADLKAVYLVEL